MKALTLWQPWASLVALGIKTIETRSWGTRYRGPLVIHAGAAVPNVARVGEWQIERHDPNYRMHKGRYETPYGWLAETPLPLGVVVATCQLVDVVPTGQFRMPTVSEPERMADRHIRSKLLPPYHAEWSVTDNLPYGDFTAGRFAWLLEDIRPTTQRCAACWARAVAAGGPVYYADCGVCVGVGSSDPVPARGRQGLWEWAA